MTYSEIDDARAVLRVSRVFIAAGGKGTAEMQGARVTLRGPAGVLDVLALGGGEFTVTHTTGDASPAFNGGKPRCMGLDAIGALIELFLGLDGLEDLARRVAVALGVSAVLVTLPAAGRC